MKLVFLIGDAAVGKMTVGQELMKQTKLRLFHNHMSIEPVLEIFGEFNGPAIRRIRETVFEEFAKTDNYGLIFTYMWAFDRKEDWDYIAHIVEVFKREHADTEVIYVELVAPEATRLERNRSENRLKHKASKRDFEASDRRLKSDAARYRLVSYDGELPFENYMKLDNTAIAPETAALMIKERFGL